VAYRKKRTGFWHNFEHLKNALFAFIREQGTPGIMPTKSELEAVNQSTLCFAIDQHGGFPVVANN
jgi:hypothetical protein